MSDKFSIKDGTIAFEDLRTSKLNNDRINDKDIVSSWCRQVAQSKDGKIVYEIEDKVEKQIVDAEVFLSQVYANLGFKTPIYCPVVKDGELVACCNSLKDFTNAKQLNKELEGKFVDKENAEHMFLGGSISPFLHAFGHSKNTIKDRLLLRFADMAAGVDYRNSNDMGYIIGFSKTKDVVPTTYYMSGYNYLKGKEPDCYTSEFTIYRQSPANILDEYKKSESVKKYLSRIDLLDFVEKFDNLDYKAIAREIEEQIHYKVDPEYVASLEKRKEQICRLIDEKCDLRYFKYKNKENERER